MLLQWAPTRRRKQRIGVFSLTRDLQLLRWKKLRIIECTVAVTTSNAMATKCILKRRKPDYVGLFDRTPATGHGG